MAEVGYINSNLFCFYPCMLFMVSEVGYVNSYLFCYNTWYAIRDWSNIQQG